MERFDLNYSLKNIPAGSERVYFTRLYDMASKFINRLRWRAYHYKDDNTIDDETELPDEEEHLSKFPVRYSAPPCDDLEQFEEDFFGALKSIRFRRCSNAFQDRLKEDISRITKSDQIFVSADKTGNMYKIDKQAYKRLITKALHKDYKKAPGGAYDDLNNRAYEILGTYKSAKKKLIPKYGRNEAFVTVKDHKAEFPSNVKCRLINPAKTYLGTACKHILDKINNIIRSETSLLQWKNTQQVITWFNEIEDKGDKCFIKYDIVDFYPSITPDNIKMALKFARTFTSVSEKEESMIYHCCDTLLFHNEEAWMKKRDGTLFDVPMGSLHGAELCELIGLAILNELQSVFPQGKCGLYRDDGLAVTRKGRRCNMLQTESRIRNSLEKMGFKITIESGLSATDFLDVYLDLGLDTFTPYRKPNSKTKYVCRSSNHPRHILDAIPAMVHGRLCRLSKDEDAYVNNTPGHMNELKLSGYQVDNLRFEKPGPKKEPEGARLSTFILPSAARCAQTSAGCFATWYNGTSTLDIGCTRYLTKTPLSYHIAACRI